MALSTHNDFSHHYLLLFDVVGQLRTELISLAVRAWRTREGNGKDYAANQM